MRIETAYFEDFEPFAPQTQITFPPKPGGSKLGEVHLLVGANGSGKTRLLCLLAAALGNRGSLAARVGNTPRIRAAVVGVSDGRKGCWSDQKDFCGWLPANQAAPDTNAVISGRAEYHATTGGLTGDLITQKLQDLSTPRFALAFKGTNLIQDEEVVALKTVALNKPGEHLLLQTPDPEMRKAVAQSLVNLKMRATMDLMQANGTPTRTMQMASQLETAIAKITSRPFAITVTHHPKVSLSVTWGGVTMLLNQLPDGLRAVLGWLAATVGKLDAAFPDHPDPLSLPIVILIDEPEAHLHPQWQRHVLPAMQHLLPNAQIIAATHSAFAISSVNEGHIHILEPDANGKVTIRKPQPCSQGDSYLDAVEDILGVREWYDPETEELLKQFRSLRDAALASKTAPNAELEELAASIAKRGPALSDMMGREMAKVNKLKKS